MDPRTAADGLPILELLTSARFIPSDAGISRQCRDLLQILEFTTEEEILGPEFNCPACRHTLLAAPIRVFLLEDVLSMLPIEKRNDDAKSNDGATSRVGGQDKGKAKAKPVDWSRFFGAGLGNGAEGYEVLETG